jgi:hypothetical protein
MAATQHEHGKMDISQNREMWGLFISMTKWSTGIVIDSGAYGHISPLIILFPAQAGEIALIMKRARFTAHFSPC